MDDSPYKPPSEPKADDQKAVATSARRLPFLLSQIVCYGWIAVLFLMWQMHGMNFLIQRDIGRLVSISTTIITILVTTLYVQLRNPSSRPHCIGYATVAALLQLGVYFTISTHSVHRFPM